MARTKPHKSQQRFDFEADPAHSARTLNDPISPWPWPISIDKGRVPQFRTGKWLMRYIKWAAQVEASGTKTDEIDQYVFRLRDFCLDHFNTLYVFVEFEHAYCYGPIDEIILYRYRGYTRDGQPKKQWGDTIRIHSQNDIGIPGTAAAPGIKQILYWLRDSSPIRQKQITRNELKAIARHHGHSKLGILTRVKSTLARYKEEAADLAGTIDFQGKPDHMGGPAIRTLLKVTGLDITGLYRAMTHGNMELIKDLHRQGKLAPPSKVKGISKFDRGSK